MAKQPHLLLNAETGWRDAALESVVTAPCTGDLQLAPAPAAAKPLTDAGGTLGGLVLPVGVALDRDGVVYVLDAGPQTVRRFDPCTRSFTTLPCIGGLGTEPRRLRDARALAISFHDDLYIADTGNQRIQVFALNSLVLRDIWDARRIASTAATSWQPVDIAAGPGGCMYVADSLNGAIHVFDRRGCRVNSFTGFTQPSHLATDCAGRIYVVEAGKSSVTVLDDEGRVIGTVERRGQVEGRFRPFAIAVDDAGNLHVSDSLQQRVTIHCLQDGGTYVELGVYSGPAADLVFDRAGNAVLADPVRKRIASVPVAARFATLGRFYSEGLDSRTYRCEWHRVAVSADIPPGCRIRIDTLTAESDKTPPEIQSMPEERWATGQSDAQTSGTEWDCLVQSPPGRFLWLRVTLEGEGSDTPSIHRLRVYFPRNSSLQYLPAVFREDPSGQVFLDQFLSIFDRVWDGFDERLRNMAAYFDPAATPAGAKGSPDFLSWLASWMGLVLDRSLPVWRRRRLLENVHRLYALRGTVEGLRLHLRLYTGSEATVLEHFRLRRWLSAGTARLGAGTALFGADIVNRIQLDERARVGEMQIVDTNDPQRDPFWASAHRFSVFVPLRGGGSAAEQQNVRRIVEMAKPAHTQADVHMLEPRFRIGTQSFVGVDTVIGRYPDQIREGKGKLGYDTVLSAGSEGAPPAMRIGKTSRLGSGTVIN